MIISIIIPAKNEEKYLPDLLASIKKQTFSDYEIIVADAGSQDKTREVANSFGAKVVEGGMPGPGRNKGAAAAKGEILLFLDADVVLAQNDFLEKAIIEFKAKNLCVAVPLSTTSSDRFLDRLFPKLWNALVIVMANISPCAGGWCIFANRGAHNRIKGFDERITLGEDSDYAYRISKVCKFGVLKNVMAYNSPRRLHKEGYAKVFLTVLGAGFYRFVLGRQDYQNKLNYKFDIYDKNNNGEKK